MFGNSLAKLGEWAESAPPCICKRERIVYICTLETCPRYSSQRLYCNLCLKEGNHTHFPLVEAGEFAGGTQKRWTDLHEEVS